MHGFSQRIGQLTFISALLILVAACQSTSSNTSIQHEHLYLDQHFSNYQQIILETEEQLFALDDAMRTMVNEKLMPEEDLKKRAKLLIDNFFEEGDISVNYNRGSNISAIEAYHTKQANCLSLTIMSYALAKEAGFDVKLQDVEIPENWVRKGEYSLQEGHVNLVLLRPKLKKDLLIDKVNFSRTTKHKPIVTIDFDPFVVKASFKRKTITPTMITAMFYVNKGAEHLVQKEYEHAYAYFRGATELAPSFSAPWVNIGILHSINNNIERAEASYRYALSIDDQNYSAMKNLIALLSKQDRAGEVSVIEKKLQQKRLLNPYYYALLADEAFYRDEYQLAIKHYRHAIRLNKKEHVFYFGLAKVYYEMDNFKQAENMMNKALRYNKEMTIKHQYIAKLNYLQYKHL
jgi:tetratricopeptide (TPR) repeat protein